MLLDVREPFRDDEVRRGLDLLRQPSVEARLELDRKRRAKRQRFQRRREAPLGEHGRVQAARELADLLKPRGELVDRAVEQRIAVAR